MGALMLIFAIAGGNPATMALPFPSIVACEAARSDVMQKLADLTNAVYAAVACVVPTKVQGT